MQTALALAVLVVSLALLLTGRRRLRMASLAASILSALDLLGIVFGVASAGIWGLATLGAAIIVGVLAWSVVLALRVDEKLTYAAIQTDAPTAELKELAKRLRARSELSTIPPVEQAELVRLLSERARSVPEIEAMAPAIGTLHVLHGESLPSLVERLDRLLRVSGKSAADAMEVADILMTTTQRAAATFTEILDGMIAVYSVEGVEAA